MSTQYHIYKNDGAGGPVDYSTVVATIAASPYTTPALALSSDTTYAVRAFDTVSSLEESNTDARVRIVVGPGGADVTAIPNSPIGLAARPGASASAVVEWVYSPPGQGAAPTGFRVWVQAGGSINYATAPNATIAYTGLRAFVATIAGLTDGTSYSVAVRAYNAAGTDPNTTTTTVVADGTPPTPVVGLTAAGSY